MHPNLAKQRLKEGRLALGLGVRQARTVDIASAAATCGFDWLFIDMEHNAMSVDAAAQIAAAAPAMGVTPIVRVPGHEHYHATRLLDNGAQGIVPPHVDDADQARRIAEACLYPPLGKRSIPGLQPQLAFKPIAPAEATRLVNEQILVVVMLESPRAIENAEEIAAVPGVDVLLIGTSDLCGELGFFVGGQVLAGILGSVVTFGYGAEGKHGANYMQSMAASVAGMAAMGVLIQTMIWLGLAEPPTWQLIAYFLCIGMLGVGLGMLYTPLVVDRMQLKYPSGLAVANILRALSDPRVLRRSIARLGTGLGLGAGLTLAAEKAGIAFLGAISFSASTFGAGMIVGARIGVPAIVVGLTGLALTPWLREIGLLGPNDPWRKVGFLISLGTILGAAIVDITLIVREALARHRATDAQPPAATEEWKKVDTHKLALWVAFWAVAVVVVSASVGVPVLYAVLGVVLASIFVLVNGISVVISDSNPISSAFVVGVTVMALAGLTDPLVGLIAGSILLISTVVGGDMQQDRSTGWRLGTTRTIQFR